MNHSLGTEGGGGRNIKPKETQMPFSPNQEWNMRVDLPVEITTASLRPDIVAWSTKAKSVLLIELTIPAEEGIKAANERKKPSTQSWLLSAGYRGYIGVSTTCLLKDAAVTRGNLKKATEELAEEAEKGSSG